MCNIASTQPEAGEEQNDRAIAPLRRSFAVTGSDQSAYLFRRQIARRADQHIAEGNGQALRPRDAEIRNLE